MSKKRKAASMYDDRSALSAFLPTSFGKKAVKHDYEGAIAGTRKKKVTAKEVGPKVVGPKAPAPVYEWGKNMPEDPAIAKAKEAMQAPTELVKLDEENPFHIPYAYEVEMKGHGGVVTALALDPSGSRLISGDYASQIKMWDFNAMDNSTQSFRTIEPEDVDNIHSIRYSPSGDRIIVSSSAKTAHMFNRDGKPLVEFIKGYPYITSLNVTKGHVARLTGAFFHPKKKDYVFTSSYDSSIRLWNVKTAHKKHHAIIRCTFKGSAQKAPVLAANVSSDGNLIVAATSDGSIQLFNADGPYHRPRARIDNAHKFGSETSSIEFRDDNVMFLSRGGDDTLKLWDSRALGKGALKEFDNLPNTYAMTGCAWSPNGRVFCTGTSVARGSGGIGRLHFYDSDTLKEVKVVDVANTSVVSVNWHEKLNQVMVGCADKVIRVMYDPEYSQKGVMYCLKKHPKRRRIEDSNKTLNIQTPHALPMFADKQSSYRTRQKNALDPVKSHKPLAPVNGTGSEGRLGSSLKASMMQKLVQHTAIDDDPREALLKYAQKGDGDQSIWFDSYRKTDPNPQFADTDDKGETDHYTNVPRM
eukprot:TRINITY_DN12844_c0_g1_i1.p1 TRINITY_DN12844_c0_g1~~TRINITY_DN12844_c0_g1_i1.p1  ORF type:complete len:583 (-),score=114.59 TRINITY_DN12844_c0_g1_i1:122-1870(-)